MDNLPSALPNHTAPKILLVSLFHPELMRGGAQQICYELFQGLKQRGDCDVTLLASTDASYPALFKAGARITGFDGRDGEFLYLMQEYDYWYHKTASVQNVEALIEFFETISPDVIHFHHFFTYGADIITLARRVLPHAKIVFTFHEFMSICAANGQMVRLTDRSLCTHASLVRCHQCFPERSPEQFLTRRMWYQTHLSNADVFTCPSRFMIEHYVRWGIDRNLIRHVTNGQRLYGSRSPARPGPKTRFGFFGQFVDNKGVQILLRAVRQLRAEGFTGFTVDLNGSNMQYASAPVREEIETFLAEEAALPLDEQIVFDNGSYHVDELPGRMSRVDWCVVPSTWWEIFGLVISEAWMFGKPVICSNAGGPAERITDNVDGLHFQLGDHRALAQTMRRACTEEGLWERLAAALPAPPSREEMVDAFYEIYTAGPATAADPTGSESFIERSLE
jgi:glycosyltransferase involved in cell wall biosynthesis